MIEYCYNANTDRFTVSAQTDIARGFELARAAIDAAVPNYRYEGAEVYRGLARGRAARVRLRYVIQNRNAERMTRQRALELFAWLDQE